MKKFQLLMLVLCASLSVMAQGGDPAFSSTHRSTTIFYGISNLFRGGAYAKDVGKGSSFTAGPVSFIGNKGISNSLSFHWGPSFMYYQYKYSYSYDGTTDAGKVNLVFGGLNFGVAYHVTATDKLDPYLGVSAGAGYYYDLNGNNDDNSYSLGGSVPLLYGVKVGVNAYDKRENAWTFELGYDYLSYLKVGYTFVRSK
jgi:hypothetical protein